MKNAIIIDQKQNGSIEVCRAAFYSRSEIVGVEIETNRLNIFDEKLKDIRRVKSEVSTRLISGAGIKTVYSRKELMALIQDLFLVDLKPVKIYKASQIHT